MALTSLLQRFTKRNTRNSRRHRLRMSLRRMDGQIVGQLDALLTPDTLPEHGRVFVVGSSDRVHLVGPLPLLPRHLAIWVRPLGMGRIFLRAFCLHPELTLTTPALPTPAGAVSAVDRLSLRFGTLSLHITSIPLADDANLTLLAHPNEMFAAVTDDKDGKDAHTHDNFDSYAQEHTPTLSAAHIEPVGSQLAFFPPNKTVQHAEVVSSIAGPARGGHAIPALLSESDDELTGSLLLHTRSGAHSVDLRFWELQRGVLIGRSRRCMLGRGFDESEGLSRLHAFVALIDGGIYAFDLASRYGLRDVNQPAKLMHAARLDNGRGCIVYGAGHLAWNGLIDD